jgi:isocitrate lyase
MKKCLLKEKYDSYDRNNLMEYNMMILSCHRADDKIRTFQQMDQEKLDFPSLITPTYHTTALHMNDLAKVILEKKECWLMLKVQRQEIRKGVVCKHQRMAGSNLVMTIKHSLLETKL